MPPCLGGKSLVTSSDGTGRTYVTAGAVAWVHVRLRSTTNPANAQTAPVVKAPRLPESATTDPQISAPRPCDASKNDENVPTTDARSLSLTPYNASSNSAGYINDIPPANTV